MDALKEVQISMFVITHDPMDSEPPYFDSLASTEPGNSVSKIRVGLLVSRAKLWESQQPFMAMVRQEIYFGLMIWRFIQVFWKSDTFPWGTPINAGGGYQSISYRTNRYNGRVKY